MRITQRISNGIALTRASLVVMRREPSLALFPLISAVTVFVVLAVVGAFGGLFALGTGVDLTGRLDDVALYAALFVVYFVGTVIATFFNAALVHNAVQVLRGRDPSLREGLAAAWGVKGRIALWGVVAATVGVIVQVIEDRSGPVGDAFAAIFDFAWTVLTFFVVPVIVFEPDRRGREMFTRSGSLVRETWGESAVTQLGIGFVAVVAAILGVVVFGGLAVLLAGSAALLVTAIVLLVAYLVVVALVASALGGITRAALYLYATDERAELPGVDLDGVLRDEGDAAGRTGGPNRSI
jgi:hypothetical protein